MKRKFNWLRKCVLSIATLFMWAGIISAQEISVTGTVTSSEDDMAIPGVSVVEKGTTNGTITDVEGKYQLTINRGSILIFSFVGMKTREITTGMATVYNVLMDPEVIGVDEVVVTALGISKEKKSLGYTITELGGDEITTVKETNVMNSLAGRVAGVTVTQGAFGPGSGTRVIIRGNNSITQNNQPLYVVDGVPIDNSGFGSASGDDQGAYSKIDYGTGVSDINPDDIESMSVLKGPNAAALYGSRAANGVILITTKKGKAQKGLGVSVSSNITFEKPMFLPDYQNTYGQGTQGFVPEDLEDLKNESGSWGPVMNGDQKLYWTGETRPYTSQNDNVKDFFETGSTYITTLAIDGGNENASVRFSYTNTTSNSILPNSRINRHNFNLRGFARIADKLTVDAKATYFYQYGKNRPTLGTEGVMSYVYDIPRNADINDYKDYQDPETLKAVSHSALGANPYWMMYNDRKEDWRNRFQGFAKIQYEFTDWLSGFVRAGTDITNQNIESVEAYGHWFYDRGRFSYNDYKTTETNLDFLLMFDRDLTDLINLSATFGGNHMYRGTQEMRINGEKFRIPDGPPLEIAEIVFQGYDPIKKKEINSLYGTVTFAYDNWLYVEASARNDWSSSLPANNWSYFYPSVSTSVLLNELLDLQGTVMDFSKIRFSWAQVGNDTDPFNLLDIYNIDDASGSYLGRTTMSRSETKNNANLKPEQVSSFEIGGEFRFLKNRIYTDLTYYNIKSQDLIMKVPVAASTGYKDIVSNVGEIQNKGFEMMIGGTPIKRSDLTWDVSLNFSKNNNELKELIEGTDVFTFSQTNSGNIFVQATVGGGFGDIYGTTFQRTEDGRLIVDATGRPLESSEKVHLGNYQPDWVGGLSNTINYKNFTFSFLIDARIGGEVYSGTDADLDDGGVSTRTLKYRDGVVLDAVVNTADPDEVPNYVPNTQKVNAQEYWGSVSGIGSEYVYDQTNIRLREASIVWKVPNSLINGTFIKDASVGVVGRNLFFFYRAMDNFDPELSYSTSNYSQGILYNPLPTTRSIGVNFNLKF
ncbi:SusC/RagA family TonB-linked outer membrane protein [Marinilabiliaceae bacterium JC017]|nr:SusC/RagA family TonB-linked outer membrane protein [Marinilabiliaceae bacterium JC017]